MLIYVRIGRERIIRIDPNLAQDIDLDDYYASTQYLPNLAHKSFEEHADVLNSFFGPVAEPRERHYSQQ